MNVRTEERKDRLRAQQWACVPAWLTGFCTANRLGVAPAAIAGRIIGYSMYKGGPITPFYQSLWELLGEERPFSAVAMHELSSTIEELVHLRLLHQFPDGRVMAGRVAMQHERLHAPEAYWCPLVIEEMVEGLEAQQEALEIDFSILKVEEDSKN